MVRLLRAASVLFMIGLLVVVALPGIASAHERRTVGKYQLTVGFLNEPALQGQPNGIDLRITNTETSKPVEGLEKTLKAEITFGASTTPAMLRSRFGNPGAYTADIIPTKAGTYSFRFFGDVEGTQVDQKFESGPSTFNDVQGTVALQFPEKLPEVSDMAARVQRAEASSQSAMTAAFIVGGLGIILGGAGIGLALAGTRSKRAAESPTLPKGGKGQKGSGQGR